MAKLADKTYGQALFDLGLEENKLDEFQKEVEMLCSLFHENQELGALLVHPQIPREEKEAVLSACFDGKVSDEISGFLHIQTYRYSLCDLRCSSFRGTERKDRGKTS